MSYMEFIRNVMNMNNLTREDALNFSRIVFNTLKSSLLTGDSVVIPKLGTFFPEYKENKRMRKSSMCGDAVDTKEEVILRFKPTRFFNQEMTNRLIESDKRNV